MLFLSGPDVEMRFGDRVILLELGNNPRVLVVNARLTYLNTGPEGKDAVLEQEWVELQIHDLKLCLNWLNFESYHDPDLIEGAPEATPERVYQDFRARRGYPGRRSDKPSDHLCWVPIVQGEVWTILRQYAELGRVHRPGQVVW